MLRKLILVTAMVSSAAIAQQDTSWRDGDRMAGTITATPQGNGIAPKMVPISPNGAAWGSATNPIATTGSTDTQGTGTLALATQNAVYAFPLIGGRNAVGLTINGLTGSGATITVERSNDGGTTWTNANTTESSATASLSAAITANGQARVGVAGATNLRLRVSTVGTGTATIAYSATTAAGPIFLTSFLPSTQSPGLGVIGNITSIGGHNLATGQVSVGTTATLIAAQRTGRQKITYAVTTAVQCSYGNAGVTLTMGFPLQAVAGASQTIDTDAAVYGVCASTATVGYLEQF